MSHDPKLTIYKIILKPIDKRAKENTFRDLFNSTLYQGKGDNTAGKEIMLLDLLKQFLKSVDTDKYIKDEKSQKAFTTYQEELGDGRTKTNVEPDTGREIIHGRLSGGPYGRKRKKSNTEDKSKQEDFLKEHVIVDEYYFLLHTPLNSNVGVLMIHSYSDDKIDNAFNAFLKKFLSYETTFKEPKIEPFVPDSIRADFKTGAIVNYLTYTTNCPGKVFEETEELFEDEDFSVTVKLKSKKRHDVSGMRKMLQTIGEKTVLGKPLKDYTTQKVFVKNEAKNLSTYFTIDTEVRPVILLKNYEIELGEDNIPNFEQIHKFALGLLPEVQQSIDPLNGVPQH